MPVSYFLLKSIRRTTLSASLAAILYILPNLLQDIHRISGHSDNTGTNEFSAEKHFQVPTIKCPVCVFEFYTSDGVKSNYAEVIPVLSIFIFKNDFKHQLSSHDFDYIDLRAPPASLIS